MMKKQFNRMRQLANQTVGRAEKTEVLSDDLLQVEKRLELVKQVSHSTHKKLTACLQGQQGVDVDKRSLRSPSKKLPLTTLAQSLTEGAAVLGEDSLLGKMLKLCGEAQDSLAQELLLFELQLEKDVLEPLYVLSEVEIPNIQKQRKHLAKLVLDVDSARARWQQSSKSSPLSNKEQTTAAKADAVREEMEEAANRMEICRDQLSADMYGFVAKEIDYANHFQMLIEVQSEYHRKSFELLQNILPQIKTHQEAWVEKPCFGKPLEEHLSVSGREIAFPIEACVTMLLDWGLQEEGLFRVAPSASKLKKLKASLDCGVLDVQEYSTDPHAIAGALKSYLRELPEPLMTSVLYDEWIQASNVQEQDQRLQALLLVCEKLPRVNSNNFRYLIKFLAKLSEYEDVNKMSAGNMAIVLGPNLLWPHTEGTISDMMTTLSLQIVRIIEPIIQHADWFFPGEIEFNLTGTYGSPVHTNHNANYSSMSSPDLDHSDRRHLEHGRRPLSVATDNMMLEFYKKDGMGMRVMDTSWVSRRGSSTSRKGSSTPPSVQLPAPPSDPQITEQPAEVFPYPSPTRSPNSNDRTSSALKCMELSPVLGQSFIQTTSPSGGQMQLFDQNPHIFRKGKKLVSILPKSPHTYSATELPPAQCSPLSLSPTPPSTPTLYGFSYPQGYATISSPSHAASSAQTCSPSALSSPPSLAGTPPKTRSAAKPLRQRPSLPPPQPPSSPPGTSPQPLEPHASALLDGLSQGDSVSTDSLCSLDDPVNNIHLEESHSDDTDDAIRMSVPMPDSTGDSGEESESTAL
ncbi:rho GTPase-activating protein 44-like isoform X3 [Brachyhypopomus gauderio]|uniref:rho GTPase-activating protein 44-like isoform X3 n=1 Tax=Brachyhypopomus gauderio TaxID=698409 RepID=UPI0040411AFC